MSCGDKGDFLEVKHSIPGRIRVRVSPRGVIRSCRQELAERLARQDGVTSHEVREMTGTVIVHHDPGRVKVSQLLELLVDGLRICGKEHRTVPPQQVNPLEPLLRSRVKGAFGGLAVGGLWNLIGLTGFLLFSLARRFWFRSPLAENAGSVTGILAGGLTVSLALKTWVGRKEGKRWGLLPFLTLACGLAVFLGEALTALEILWVLSLGGVLEGFIAERSRRTISEALGSRAESAYLVMDGTEVEVPVSRLQVGDLVWVASGAYIPVDGMVEEGEALVDESQISGRAMPELRRAAAPVFSGTRVVEGFLYIRADRVGSDTYLSRTLQLVEDSLARRADVEKRADLLAARLTRMGILVTVVTLVVTRSLQRALSVALVMSCPCATVLATSTALAAAIANAARRGIIIKGGMSLERLSGIDTVCFDKTGTLTSDVPEIVEVVPRAPWMDEGNIMELAAWAEQKSNHPLAKGVMKEAGRRGIRPAPVEELESFIGRGVAVRRGGEEVLVGNRALLEERGIGTGYFKKRREVHSGAGRTVIYVAKNRRLQGMVVMENRVRPGAEELVGRLRESGVAQMEIMSGDSEQVVEVLGESLGLDAFQGDLLPEEKAAHVRRLESSGRRVLMVGDGVNDALALAEATAGVAMGVGGAEVALIAADICLLTSDLLDLAYARDLSRRCLQVIEQNFWLAVTTDLVGGTMAALGRLPPFLGGIVHVAHSLLIGWNSGRLVNWDPSVRANVKKG